jgi:hypothetical protein
MYLGSTSGVDFNLSNDMDFFKRKKFKCLRYVLHLKSDNVKANFEVELFSFAL